MRSFKIKITAGMIGLAVMFAVRGDANAQYAVAVQPVVPAVVGYTAERRGLFRQRVVIRQVVAPVAAAVSFSPVVPARPVVAARVAAQYASATAPVVSHDTPSASFATQQPPAAVAAFQGGPGPILPVRTYRVPLTYLYGF